MALEHILPPYPGPPLYSRLPATTTCGELGLTSPSLGTTAPV